jgi:hypothetical protein
MEIMWPMPGAGTRTIVSCISFTLASLVLFLALCLNNVVSDKHS